MPSDRYSEPMGTGNFAEVTVLNGIFGGKLSKTLPPFFSG